MKYKQRLLPRWISYNLRIGYFTFISDSWPNKIVKKIGKGFLMSKLSPSYLAPKLLTITFGIIFDISKSISMSHTKHIYSYGHLKAMLQVLIYKALYDKSYLGSKTTMTSGEWTCLISFATAPLTCSERGGSEKFKMKIYVSRGIRTHTPPVHDRKVAAR